MNRILLQFAALVSWGTAAQACECDDPAAMSAKDQDERAQWIAKQGFVIAEVVRMAPADPMQPERYRVLRPILGEAPSEIVMNARVTRLPDGQMVPAPVTSCDYSGPIGQAVIMAFSDRGALAPCGVLSRLSGPALRPAGMCTQFAVQEPAILNRVKRLLRMQER